MYNATLLAINNWLVP